MVNQFVWQFVKQEKLFKYYVFWYLIVSLIRMYIPIRVGKVVESATAHNLIFNEFLIACSIYLGLILMESFIAYVTRCIANTFYANISLKATKRLYNITLDKPISFILEHSSGNISHKIKNTYDIISVFITSLYHKVFIASVVCFGLVGIIAYILPSLGLAFIILGIIYIIVFNKLAHKLKQQEKLYNSSKDNLFAFITDTVANILLVKSFAKKDIEDKSLNNLGHRTYESNLQVNHYSVKLNALESASFAVFMSLTVIYSGYMVFIKELSIADFVVLNGISVRVSHSLNLIITGINDYFRYSGTLENTLELLKPELIKGKKKLKFNNGDIELKDLTFAYNDEKIFKNFNLTIKNRETVALVGKSGAGKSTLIYLLQRFYETSQGEILFNNQEIKNLNEDSLRANIAYIPQEPGLLSRSVYDNIAYGNPKASKKQVLEAAKFANADEFIQKLPNGYDELVGERGFKLSGGQKQRIAIARAILKDAPIIIMDEATSALDSYSEKLIQESLLHLLKGKTCIIIAHRLSTIKSADRVIVLENGKVSQDGSHKSLIRKVGLYKELWDLQHSGFIVDDV